MRETTDLTIKTCIALHRGRLVAWLTCKFNDVELAEDVLQEAIIAAFESWPLHGVPDSADAWLLKTAHNKAIDRLRRMQSFTQKSEELAYISSEVDEGDFHQFDDPISDERLRLIFTCCHPALSEEARVALTLKVVAGLSTAQIARAFLLPETTLAQRIVRAKKKIKAAKIPYVTPAPEHWRSRINAVLAVIYLIFNEGYSASNHIGKDDAAIKNASVLIQAELCEEAIRLASLFRELLQHFPQQNEATPPAEPHDANHCMPVPLNFATAETFGLLALMHFHDARRNARLNEQGEYVTLADQNRQLWQRSKIELAESFLQQAMQLRARGPYQVQAAISALHCHAKTYEHTDWKQICMLYGVLYSLTPTPVVKLNHIVALSYYTSPQHALEALQTLQQHNDLSTYQPFHAVQADLLRRCEQYRDASAAYERAIKYANNAVERAFLTKQLNALPPFNHS